MFWDFWFGGFKQNSHPSLFQPNRKALCTFSMVKWPNSDILSEHTLSHNKPTLTFGTCSQLLQLSGSECVFSAEDRKVEQEQHLALVTESLQTWCSCPPSSCYGAVCCMPLLSRTGVMFRVMISSSDCHLVLPEKQAMHSRLEKWRPQPHIHHCDEGSTGERPSVR